MAHDLEYMNEAGEHLCSMYKWGWLRRAPQLLDLIVGQSFVNLPVDCQSVGSIITSPSSGLQAQPFAGSMEEVLASRALSPGGFPYIYAISYAGNPPAPRLEIAPTPTTTQFAAWTLFYRGGWITLQNTDDTLPFPVWLKPLYMAILMAVRQGYEEHDNGTVSERLMIVQGGLEYRNAVRRDRSMSNRQGRYGLEPSGDWDTYAFDRLGPVTGP